jgi:hypothetical protein
LPLDDLYIAARSNSAPINYFKFKPSKVPIYIYSGFLFDNGSSTAAKNEKQQDKHEW